VEVDGVAYSLAQFHFHAPSEHTVEGRHFPVEVHFVHVNEAGELAVAGAFFEEGEHNEAFAPIFADLPTGEGEVRDLEGLELDLDSLVPVGSPYYRYLGSLTTPPCSEGVEWFVRTEPLSLSAGQIAEFKAIFDGNRRPTQPLNGRNVTQEEAAYVDQAAEAGS
jgi:carbonic anhydrase